MVSLAEAGYSARTTEDHDNLIERIRYGWLDLESTATYAPIAKHFGVRVRPCPPRHGNRKGAVEKANHTAAQRWWRTLPDDVTVDDFEVATGVFIGCYNAERSIIDAFHTRGLTGIDVAVEALK